MEKNNQIQKHNNSYMFEPFWEDFFSFPLFKESYSKYTTVLKTDITEKGDEYIFEIEVPGYSKDNLSIDYENEYLTITAEKTQAMEDTDNKYNHIKRERHLGKASRSFYIGKVDEKQIKANLKDGTLTIAVPKHITPSTKNKILID